MEISAVMSDPAVLDELGSRVSRSRLDREWTQAYLAKEAGVSRPTVERMERGDSTQMTSFIRVLRALGLLERLDNVLQEETVRPLDLIGHASRRRKRAPSTPGKSMSGEWQWGEDDDS